MACTKCGSELSRPRLEVVCCSGPGDSNAGERCGLKYLPSCAQKIHMALQKQHGNPGSSAELALSECFHCTESLQFRCPCKGGHGKMFCNAYAQRQKAARKAAHQAQQQLDLQGLPPAVLQLALKDVGLHNHISAVPLLVNPMMSLSCNNWRQAIPAAAAAVHGPIPLQHHHHTHQQQHTLLLPPVPQQQEQMHPYSTATGAGVSHHSRCDLILEGAENAGGCDSPASQQAAAGGAAAHTSNHQWQSDMPSAMDTDTSATNSNTGEYCHYHYQQQLDPLNAAAAGAACCPSAACMLTAERTAATVVHAAALDLSGRQYCADMTSLQSSAVGQQQWQQQLQGAPAFIAAAAAVAAVAMTSDSANFAPGDPKNHQQQEQLPQVGSSGITVMASKPAAGFAEMFAESNCTAKDCWTVDLHPLCSTVNLTATCSELPGEGAFSTAAKFLQELLGLECEDDLAIGANCISALTAVGDWWSHPLRTRLQAAATEAAAEHPASNSSSSNLPLQLCNWLWDCADAAAEGRFANSTSTTAAAAVTGSSTNTVSSSSNLTVLSAAAGGGVVAYCQQGWGAYLPPGAPDTPVLQSISTHVLPVGGTSSTAHIGSTGSTTDGSSTGGTGVTLELQGRNLKPHQHVVYAKQGRQLHVLPLLPSASDTTAAAAAAIGNPTLVSTTAAAATHTGSVILPSNLLQQPGVLLLSVTTGQHFVTDSQPLLVLPAHQTIVEQLNDMIRGPVGVPLLSWLALLLLQPEQKLQQQLAACAHGSSSSSSTDTAAATGAAGGAYNVASTVSQEAGVAANPEATTADGAGMGLDRLMHLRVASLKAMAAYNLLAVSIHQQKLDVVTWLLQILAAETHQAAAAAMTGEGTVSLQQQQMRAHGPTVQQALVAQQRLAWCGAMTGQQVPLLLLAGSTCSAEAVHVLQHWSISHGLPADWSSGWRGVSLQEVFQQQQQQRQGGCLAPPFCQPAVADLQEAVQQLLTNQQQLCGISEVVAAAAAAATAEPALDESSPAWVDLGFDVANMLKADSLLQLEAVLGAAGNLPAAVAAGNIESVQRLLATLHSQTSAAQQQQQQLDIALEFAAILGHSRLDMAKLLLLHGANPYSRGGAALAWAARRCRTTGETAMQLLLCKHASACSLGSSSSGGGSSSSDGGGSGSSSDSDTASPCCPSSFLAVSGWCIGLHQELSGLHQAGCQAKLQSLQQWLASCPVQQRTVGNLVDALRLDCGQQGCGLFLDADELSAVARVRQTREAIAASSNSSSRGQVIVKPQPAPGDWQFLQCFGERQEGEEVQEADVISAVSFDADGSYLATGDRGGRVVLFEKVPSQMRFIGAEQRQPVTWGPGFEFRYLTEFQSHEPEFDYLKSMEIEEGINQVKWVRSNGSGAKHLLSTNDKTIKLWKIQEKNLHVVTGWNIERAGLLQQPLRAGAGVPPAAIGRLRMPTVLAQDRRTVSRSKRIFANAHTYHINSIAVNSDQQTFLSADDLRLNLWSLEVPNRCFNMLDIKPQDMATLSEVITCADFHPQHCHMFAYSSSKGSIRLGDMRSSALCDRHAKVFEEQDPSGNHSYFSEIIASISSLRFSTCGRYMLSRDYMHLKLWDLAREDSPVMTLAVHEEVRARLGDLYENDCIFDKFGCSMNGPGTCFTSGTYSNTFKVFDCNSAVSQASQPAMVLLPGASPPAATALEASRDPMRTRFQPGAGASLPEPELDCGMKLLHMAWHPEANVIACAAANSLYMYCA